MSEFALSESRYSGNGMGQHYTNPEHIVVQQAIHLARETEAQHILDIACGRGIVSLALARRLSPLSITAFDISHDGVSELNNISKKEGLPISAVIFDASDENGYTKELVAPESIDLVIAKDVYPFLTPSQNELLFQNIDEALKPEGWVIITAPSTRSRLYNESTPTATPLYQHINQAAKDYIQTDLNHFSFTTIEDLAKQLREHHVEMVEASHYGRAKGWIVATGQKQKQKQSSL